MRILVTGAAGFIGSRLAARLLADGVLAGAEGAPRAIEALVLVDPVAPALAADPRVQVVIGDAADPAVIERAVGAGVDAVFVLGAALTTAAERDVGQAFELHVLGLARLLETLRRSGRTTRLVFASSIAAFGGRLPPLVGDDVPLRPQTSYGTHKAIAELLIHDHARHGFVDGRCLRLPIVVVRPRGAAPSVSERIGALVREPLAGRDVVCPWAPQTRVPLASVQTVVDALLAVHALPASAFGDTRSLNLPALTVRIVEWVGAAQRIGERRRWTRPLGAVSWQADAALQAIVDGWPQGFDSALARRLGIAGDRSLEAIVERHADEAHATAALPAGPKAAPPPVCIIGAGSSGIVTAKALKARGIAFEVFEKGSQLGGMWRYENDNGLSSAYRSLHIDTSRKSLAYPDFPLPAHLPDFLSHVQVLEYFEAYAAHFGIVPHIRFDTEVAQVEPVEGGGWDVTLGSGERRRYASVIVANGHLSHPRLPEFAGHFDGEQIHSHHYRTPTPYEGKRVLVVGIGNSAVDIAVDLCRSARSVALSTRRGAWVVPKYIMGIPTDRWGAFLGRTFRLPTPWVRRVMGKLIYLAVGNQERYGVPKPAHPIWREHACVSQDLLPYVGHGWVQMRRNIRELQGDRVLFEDGTVEPFDCIIHATGYRTVFPFLRPDVFEARDNDCALYRRIAAPGRPGLFFAGLVQPIGPTIPLVEIQGRWIAGVLAGSVKLPDRAAMQAEIAAHRRAQQRYVESPRYTLEVDFREHAAQLTADLALTSA